MLRRTTCLPILLVAACGGGSISDHDPDGGQQVVIDAMPGPPDAEVLTASAPVPVTIVCPGAIPVEGKIDCQITIGDGLGGQVYSGGVGVGLHGRSSLSFPKHQYAIELRHPDGSDNEIDLFGMGADADWLLNGAYIDRSLMRNKVAYDLFRAMGHFAPDSRFVELTLDGDYLGVFTMLERVERNMARLGLPADDGSGSTFIMKGSEEGLIASAVQHASWEALYPEPSPPGVATRLGAFEAAIQSHADSMFDSQVDLETLVDFVILEETLKNNDAYWLSQHIFVGGGGKVSFVPWDLDLSFGQPSYNDSELTDGWLFYRSELIAGAASTPAFKARLVARWQELRAGILATDAVQARLHAYRAALGDAIGRNWTRWDITEPANIGFPLYQVTSPDDEYAKVDAWIAARLVWIDANIASYAP